MRVVVHAEHVAAVALQRLHRHPAVDVPYSDRRVVGRGCEERAIRGPRNVRQALAVSLQSTHYLTRVRGPQLYELVRRYGRNQLSTRSTSCSGGSDSKRRKPTTRRKKLAVWTKLDRGDAHCVSAHGMSQGIVWAPFVRLWMRW